MINGGRLDYKDDDRKLTFTGTVKRQPRTWASATAEFEMVGKGALNAQPFDLRVTGGPLLNIDRNKPYPFDADVHAGETYVTAQGAVPKPFDLSQFYVNVTSRGPDLADLYGLTGVPLPNTPPYALHGRLSRDGHLWKIDGVGGRVGSSDLAGSLSVLSAKPRPMLTANLSSKTLVFQDMGPVFGGTRHVGPVASPKQVAVARQMQAEQRIFPTATLNFDRIRKIDADVTYRAASVSQAPINLRAASVKVKLTMAALLGAPSRCSWTSPRGGSPASYSWTGARRPPSPTWTCGWRTHGWRTWRR